jgi:hypothetical protein
MTNKCRLFKSRWLRLSRISLDCQAEPRSVGEALIEGTTVLVGLAHILN